MDNIKTILEENGEYRKILKELGFKDIQLTTDDMRVVFVYMQEIYFIGS